MTASLTENLVRTEDINECNALRLQYAGRRSANRSVRLTKKIYDPIQVMPTDSVFEVFLDNRLMPLGAILTEEQCIGLHRLVRVAFQLGRVLTLDAQQARCRDALGRVDIAFVVDMRHARLKRVDAAALDLAGLAFGGGFEDLPVAHFSFAKGLAVDRPGAAVIVRVGFARFAVDMGADAESQFGIFVDHLAVGGVVVDVSRDELFVLERLLHQIADFLPARSVRFGFQNALDICGERFKRETHGSSSFFSDLDDPTFNKVVWLASIIIRLTDPL